MALSTGQIALVSLLALFVGFFLSSNPNGIPDLLELHPRPSPPITIPLCTDDTLKKTKIYAKGTSYHRNRAP
jgi:hypothetical protein